MKNAMKISNVCFDDEDGFFEIEGVDCGFVNAIRRSMIADVPIIAINEVNMKCNTTNIPDEYIAHRLSLLPIHEEFRRGELLCEAKDDDVEVFSKDILFEGKKICTEDNALLLRLKKGQKIHVCVAMSVATGRKHAKWCAVATAYYSIHTRGVLHKECFCKRTNWSETCELCGNRKRDKTFQFSPTYYKFQFSTSNNLSPVEILFRALDSLKVEASRISGECANVQKSMEEES